MDLTRERSRMTSAGVIIAPNAFSWILDGIQDGVFALDRDWRFIYVNRRAAEDFGRPPGELIGKHIWEQFPEIKGTAQEAAYRRAMNKRQIQRYELGGSLTQGWYGEVVYPSKDGITVCRQDLTERRQMEESLRESEARFRALVGAIAQGVWEADAGGIVTNGLQASGSSVLGPEDWVGSVWLNSVHPDDREPVEQQWLEALAARGNLNTECRLKHRCGEWQWANVLASPVTDRDGNISKWVGMTIDVTRRMQTEAALAEHRTRLTAELRAAQILQELSTKLILTDSVDALYDHLLVGVAKALRADRSLIQLFCPDQGPDGAMRLFRHYGFDADDISSWEWVPVGAPSSCGLAARTHQRVAFADILRCEYMAGGQYLEDYLRIGVRSVQTTPILSRSGTLLGMFSTYWHRPRELTATETRLLDVLARQVADLIERTRVEQALRESEERYRVLAQRLQEADENKNAFLAALSHELRNPLASIAMSSSILRSFPHGEQADKAKQTIERQVAQLTRIVDDLLDVTRMTRDKLGLRKESIELCGLLLKVVEDHRVQFSERGIELHAELGPDPLHVSADPARLTQAVGNLLDNAAKFTERRGKTLVVVTKDAERSEVVITVQDNGAGIPPDALPRLFQPFVQVENTLDRTKGGLGLGLSLVRGIAELHGGSATAFSEGVGKGARFTIRLPLDLRGESVQTPGLAGAEEQTRPLRILVIEDNLDFAGVLCEALSLLGHETASAAGGPEGLAKAREFRPDVAICDIGLPGMSGYEVAAHFRSDAPLAGTYLVALSGYAQPEDLLRSEEAGFDRHLAKPVQIEALAGLLAEVQDG